MSDPVQSMIDNLPAKTGRSLEEWFTVLGGTQLEKHTELMNHLKQEYGVSHGFANGIVLRATGTAARFPRATNWWRCNMPARRPPSARSTTPSSRRPAASAPMWRSHPNGPASRFGDRNSSP